MFDDESFYDDEGNETLIAYKVKVKVTYELEIEIEAGNEIEAREYALDALNDYGAEIPSPHDNEYDIIELREMTEDEIRDWTGQTSGS